MEDILSLYRDCRLCGRTCGVDRSISAAGFCRESSTIRAAFAGLHQGEEPVLTRNGSGTIFFSGCTLKCFFCQNHQISCSRMGSALSIQQFADLCLSLQDAGADNINLVTGSQWIPSIASGLRLARRRGLRLPVLWNSSGYESPEGLETLRDVVDVWLPDLKLMEEPGGTGLGLAVLGAADYASRACDAITWMMKQSPPLLRDGLLLKGTIIRHLVMPGLVDATRRVLEWVAALPPGWGMLSLMFQYTPLPLLNGDAASRQAGQAQKAASAGFACERGVSKAEYDQVMAILEELGLEDGFVQEFEDMGASPPLLPDFSRPDAFPGGLAKPIWSWVGPVGEEAELEEL